MCLATLSAVETEMRKQVGRLARSTESRSMPRMAPLRLHVSSTTTARRRPRRYATGHGRRQDRVAIGGILRVEGFTRAT